MFPFLFHERSIAHSGHMKRFSIYKFYKVSSACPSTPHIWSGFFLRCLILFVRRVRRVSAGSFLHPALHGIPGFLPVGILKAVVKFLLEPLHISDDPAQGPVHLWKEDLRQPVQVFSAQGCTGTVQQIREVRQAVSLCAGSDMMCSCFI